jgi:superfamily II DNA helicase RecQ
MMALTATANNKVFDDVKRTLGLHTDCFELRKSFNRSNLRYEVLPKTSKMKTAKEMATKCLTVSLFIFFMVSYD